jgi:hypothetical protein
MGFFEKTAGDGFFQKVEIMFGTELNIISLKGRLQRDFNTSFIQFAVLDTRYMNICLEKSNGWDKNFHNRT